LTIDLFSRKSLLIDSLHQRIDNRPIFTKLFLDRQSKPKNWH